MSNYFGGTTSPLNEPSSASAGHNGAGKDDPALPSHMKDAMVNHVQRGFETVKRASITAAGELRQYVQEGPAGVSILCFGGGFFTALVGIVGLFSISTILSAPFSYILSAYIGFFGVVTVLLEADVESLKRMTVLGRTAPFVEKHQVELFERAKVLMELRGRGFFYLFIGVLAITQCSFCFMFLSGVWNLGMGLVCVLMSFGINPASRMPGAAKEHEGIPLTAPENSGV